MWRRRLLVPLLLAAACCASASAEEWPGWRGLRKQGRSAADGPVRWSATKNVRWTTPIPGKGHSSPVVAGRRVILTTGIPTRRGQRLKQAVSAGALALTVLAALAALAFVIRRRRAQPPKPEQYLPAALLCLLLGLWVHLAVAALLRFGGSAASMDARMDLWLFAAQSACLCVVLSSFALRRSGRAQLSLTLVTLLFGGLFLLGRPAPGYYRLVGHPEYSGPLQRTAGLPVLIVLGFVVAALRWRGRTPAEGGDTPAAEHGPRRLVLLLMALGAFVVGLAALGVPMLLAGYYHFRGAPAGAVAYRWSLIPAGPSSLAVTGGCVLLWVAVEWTGPRPTAAVLPWGFAVVFLAVGVLSFWERNYLLGTRELVRAIVGVDSETGAVAWVREGLRGPQPAVDARNSPATPTAAMAAGRVVAWFGSAGLVCTDLEGKVLWTRTDVPFGGVHGVGASPVVADGQVIIYGGQPRAPYVAAFDAATGQRRWTTKLRPWPGREGQHRTPAVATAAGQRVLLIWGWEGPKKEDYLRAYALHAGRELWRYPLETNGEQVASVVVEGDTAWLVNTRRAVALSLAKASRGDKAELWTTDLKRKGPYTSSPVLARGMLFLVSHTGVATCLDARSGRRLWQQRLGGREYLASVVAAGSRVYFCNTSGLTTVVAAERGFRKLGESRLPEAIIATPAPVAGRLFLRTSRHLWCIEP